jgi:hypothetical protein
MGKFSTVANSSAAGRAFPWSFNAAKRLVSLASWSATRKGGRSGRSTEEVEGEKVYRVGDDTRDLPVAVGVAGGEARRPRAAEKVEVEEEDGVGDDAASRRTPGLPPAEP